MPHRPYVFNMPLFFSPHIPHRDVPWCFSLSGLRFCGLSAEEACGHEVQPAAGFTIAAIPAASCPMPPMGGRVQSVDWGRARPRSPQRRRVFALWQWSDTWKFLRTIRVLTQARSLSRVELLLRSSPCQPQLLKIVCDCLGKFGVWAFCAASVHFAPCPIHRWFAQTSIECRGEKRSKYTTHSLVKCHLLHS